MVAQALDNRTQNAVDLVVRFEAAGKVLQESFYVIGTQDSVRRRGREKWRGKGREEEEWSDELWCTQRSPAKCVKCQCTARGYTRELYKPGWY